jgi:hypothetical protein
MRTIIFSFLMIIPALNAFSQADSWKIRLNNIVILSTKTEDETKNTRKIKSSEWKKSGYLQITYKEMSPGWSRSFLFFDETDQEVLRKDSTVNTKIPLATLRKLMKGKKELHIYTIAYPPDPNMGVRLRRVHLCTLKLP